MSAEPWGGLVLAIGPDRAVVSAEGARLLLAAITHVERMSGRDGVGLSTAPQRARAELRLICGTAEAREEPAIPDLTDDDWMPATAAAEELRMSREYLGKLARDGVFGRSVSRRRPATGSA